MNATTVIEAAHAIKFAGRWWVRRQIGHELFELCAGEVRAGRVLVQGVGVAGERGVAVDGVRAVDVADRFVEWLDAQPSAQAALEGWRRAALALSAAPESDVEAGSDAVPWWGR